MLKKKPKETWNSHKNIDGESDYPIINWIEALV